MPENVGQNVRHTERERWRTTSSGNDGVLPHRRSSTGELFGHKVRARKSQGVHKLSSTVGFSTSHGGWSVHREVHMTVQNNGGDESHDGHEGLHEHAAVPNHAHLRFFFHQLGRGPRGNQRVEPRESTASDGDEKEGEQIAGKNWPVAVFSKVGDGGHVHLRAVNENTYCKQPDHANLHKGGQVIAWRKQ